MYMAEVEVCYRAIKDSVVPSLLLGAALCIMNTVFAYADHGGSQC